MENKEAVIQMKMPEFFVYAFSLIDKAKYGIDYRKKPRRDGTLRDIFFYLFTLSD